MVGTVFLVEVLSGGPIHTPPFIREDPTILTGCEKKTTPLAPLWPTNIWTISLFIHIYILNKQEG